MMIWYVPGWMRTGKAQDGVLESLRATFPEAEVSFKGWNGNLLIWPKAVENADAAVSDLVAEIAALQPARRDSLVLIGHSLGGRIVARALARLDERSLKVRQAVLMAAAISYADKDVRWIGNGSALPVLVLCNPDDVTLKYVYAMAGGEKSAALGADGALQDLVNVKEFVVPASLVRETKIDRAWAGWEFAKEVANHHALFYIACLRKIVLGEELPRGVLVPQDFVTVEWPAIDSGIWWEDLERSEGWKLQRNKVTGHARILDPKGVRKAWGALENIRRSFAKVRRQVEGRPSHELPIRQPKNEHSGAVGVRNHHRL